MRLLALGWLVGTAWLQSRADLPVPTMAGLALIVGLLLLMLALGCRQWRGSSVVNSTPSSFAADSQAHIAAGAAQSATSPSTTPPSTACLLVLVAAGLLAGAGWSASRAHWRLGDALPAAMEGRDLQVIGIVASLPDDVSRGQRFRFDVESALDGGRVVHVPAVLALGWYDGVGGEGDDAMQRQAVRPGERWQWTIRLRQPHGLANPDGFDEEAWLLSEGVRASGYVRPQQAARLDAFVFSVRDLVGRVRLLLRERIMQALPSSQHAGVIVALVMGDQRGIAEPERQLFNLTGIGHLVSISGLHITMLAALAAAFARLVWRYASWSSVPLPLRMPAQRAGALAGLLVATIYVAMAGFGVPAQRTLLMLAVVTAAQFGGRLLPPSRVLATALLVVLVVDPWAPLWPGFWLSFGAIACILFASAGRAGYGDQRAQGEQITRWWQRYLAAARTALASAARTQMIVTAGLVPLSVGLFGQLSLVGPLANAVAIPVVSFIVAPLALMGVILPQPLCRWLLAAAHAAFSALIDSLQAMVSLTAAFSHGGLPTDGMAESGKVTTAALLLPQPDAIALAIAVVGTLWLLAPRGWPWRSAGLLCWLPLFFASPSAPAGGFWLTALDIGQGNAVLIETAHHRLLYDTGPAWPSGSDAGARVIVPYLRSRGIDYLDTLMVSHADLDHSGGAASVLAALPVGWFASSLTDTHPLLQGRLRHVACVAGQRWQWDGVWFEVIHPLAVDRDERKTNARSCTLRISAGDQVALLAGDIERAQELALLAREGQALHAQVLLAPHHGSGTSSTAAFLDTVRPEWALFQVGYRNRYHHPKAEVVERYRARGIRMQRSDEAGAIRIAIGGFDGSGSRDHSGQKIQVRSYRCEQRRYWRPAPCTPD